MTREEATATTERLYPPVVMPQNPEQKRKAAVQRYRDGEKIDAICKSVPCSKTWLYKWVDRYDAHNPDWAKERSKKPVNSPNKTPQVVARLILQLYENGSGISAIRLTLQQQAIKPLPTTRTIYRILQNR